jgi:20S proteasome alpha/beta subunit
MTLIAALQGQDGLVMGSDSRATIGDPRGLTAINDVQKKLSQLSKYWGIAVSGASELAERLVDILSNSIKGQNLENIDDIVNSTYDLFKKEYSNWFGTRTWVGTAPIIDQRPVLVFILAGFNKLKDSQFQSRIYLINSQLDFAPQLCPSGHMLAGIPQYATYLIHRLYNPQMAVVHLRALAAYLISETATQDPKVGGPIRIAEITPEKGYQELDESIVNEIIKKNEEQNLKLRKFFFEG